MGHVYWLTFLFGFAASADMRPDFPFSQINLTPADKQFLFLDAVNEPTAHGLLVKIVGGFPDWRVLIWPDTSEPSFRDDRVSATERSAFLKMLDAQLDSTHLGAFVPAESKLRPLHLFSVLAFKAEPSRATILHELLHAMLNQRDPRGIRKFEELEIVAFLVHHRDALHLEDQDLTPQIENLLAQVGAFRRVTRAQSKGLENLLNQTVRRLDRFLYCATNLSEED